MSLSFYRAGIGRTGVFIALDVLTQHLSLDEKYIDVFGTVVMEREERTNMVQTVVSTGARFPFPSPQKKIFKK